MNTITIKNGEKLKKTSFEDNRDLFVFLKQELMPFEVYLIDEETVSETSLQKIKDSKNNPNRKLTNFQG